MLLIERPVQEVKVIETKLNQSLNVLGGWSSKVHPDSLDVVREW